MTPSELKALPYKDYLRTNHWRVVRRAALDHYGRNCCLCGSSKSVDVHHRTYKHLGDERLQDLSVLCRTCHDKYHEAENDRIRERFVSLIAEDVYAYLEGYGSTSAGGLHDVLDTPLIAIREALDELIAQGQVTEQRLGRVRLYKIT